MAKKLYKSSKNSVFSGVCGGIANYFNIDPTLVRLLWVGAAFFGVFPGIIVYIICAFVIPEEPSFDEPIDVPFSN